MNPRIVKILSIEPYRIKALWTDSLVREVDFTDLLKKYAVNGNSFFDQLLKKEIFLTARTDGRTIYWDGIVEMIDQDGRKIPAPLDFDPDVLFGEASTVE